MDIQQKREELSNIAFHIIAFAGEAKSLGVEAIQAAKESKFDIAEEKLKEARKKYGDAAHKHLSLIQKEAKGEQIEFMLIFMHAEDILLTTESFLLLAKEHIEIQRKFNDVYKKLHKEN